MLEQVHAFRMCLAPSPTRRARPEYVIQRVGPLCRAGGFRTDQLPTECVGDAARDLALNGEKVADILVKMLCPEMRVV